MNIEAQIAVRRATYRILSDAQLAEIVADAERTPGRLGCAPAPTRATPAPPPSQMPA